MIRLKKPSKKIAGIALIASLLLVPSMVSVYAQSNDEAVETPVVTQTDETDTPDDATPTDTETPAEETPETPAEETPAEETPEVPVEDPETPVVNDGVTLGEAQIIAQTEHSGSTLKAVKTKVLDGNAVYVFHFEDGWKVSVRATDGVVVEVKDPSEHNHGCKNKLENDAAFQAWLQKRKDQRHTNHTEDNNDNKENIGHSNRGHKHWSHN